MFRPGFSKFTFSITILFVCATIPAFAQHGGGGHGGGGSHGGGGGFHGGGGGSRGGGSGMSSAPRSGGGIIFARSAGSAPQHYGGGSLWIICETERQQLSFLLQPGKWKPEGGGFIRGASRNCGWGVAFVWRRDRKPRGWRRNRRPSACSTGGGWQVLWREPFGKARVEVTRSFSGQGNQIWENAPASEERSLRVSGAVEYS